MNSRPACPTEYDCLKNNRTEKTSTLSGKESVIVAWTPPIFTVMLNQQLVNGLNYI